MSQSNLFNRRFSVSGGCTCCNGCTKRFAKVVDGVAVTCRTNCPEWQEYLEQKDAKYQVISKERKAESVVSAFEVQNVKRYKKCMNIGS